MHEKIKHPVLLTIVVLLVAGLTLLFWYLRIERAMAPNVLPPSIDTIPEAPMPPESEVPPASLLPATPALVPEIL